MKWLLFLFSINFLFGCKDRGYTSVSPEKEKVNSPFTGFGNFPFRTETDTGYFSGTDSHRLKKIEGKDTTTLGQFLEKIISKKDIILLDSQTLSHTVFIDQNLKIRTDTLKNATSKIICIYMFGRKNNTQKIEFNGKAILGNDIFDIDENSFRHFSFKGKKYYFFQAMIMDAAGTSTGNICYHFIFDSKFNLLTSSETCRFKRMLFGDVNNDDNLDFLDFNNSDFCTTVPGSDSVSIHFYSDNHQGRFDLQKNSQGRPFFIEGRTGSSYLQDSFNIKNCNWPIPIN